MGDNSIKKSELFAAILPCLAVLLVFHRAVLGEMMNSGDVIYQAFNYFNYYANGGPIVSENILGGFPIFASVMGIWFYGVNDVFISLFGAFHGYLLMDVANVILAYILALFFARSVGLSWWGAILSGSVYVFSGQLMLWVQALDNSNYYWLLPAVLLAFEYAEKSAGVRRWLMYVTGGVLLGAGWLSGHVQFVAYIHAFACVYWLAKRFGEKWIELAKNSPSLLISLAASFWVGYPQIKAILDMSVSSGRVGGVGLEGFWLGAYMPQDFIHFFLPFFRLPFVSFSSPNLYVGILPLILIVIFFVNMRKILRASRVQVRTMYLFAATFAFCALASIKYSPIGLLVHYLPFFDAFREAPRIMFIGDFAAALLAGMTLDYIVSNRDRAKEIFTPMIRWIRRIILWVILPVAIAASAIRIFFVDVLTGILSDYYFAHSYSPSSALPKSHYISLIASYVRQAIDEFVIYDKDVVILILFLTIAYFLLKNIATVANEKRAALFVVLVSIANLTLVYFGHFDFLPKSAYAERVESAEYIKSKILEDGMPARTHGIFPAQTLFSALSIGCPTSTASDSFHLSSELLMPNRNMDLGVDILSGYDNFMPVLYSELLDQVGAEQSVTKAALINSRMPVADKVRIIAQRKNLLRAMNVRFVVSHYPIDDPDFVPQKRILSGACAVPVNLYELRDYWPRYFTANKTVSLPGGMTTDDIAFVKLVESEKGPFVSIAERDTDDSVRRFASADNVSKVVPVRPLYNYDGTLFEVDTPTETVFFIGNAYLPNYRATVNGEPARIYRANHAFMAIILPAGKNRIVLEYPLPERPFVSFFSGK